MKAIKFLSFLLVFSLSGYAYSYVWVNDAKIIKIQGVNNGGFLLYLDKNAGSECSNAGQNAIYVYPDESGVNSDAVKTLLSLSMLAFSTGKFVDIQYDNSHPSCWGRYITVK